MDRQLRDQNATMTKDINTISGVQIFLRREVVRVELSVKVLWLSSWLLEEQRRQPNNAPFVTNALERIQRSRETHIFLLGQLNASLEPELLVAEFDNQCRTFMTQRGLGRFYE